MLGVCFDAFGKVVPLAVRVMGYFLGALGSLLRLPRGVGGVEGGMIGASVAFGFPVGSAVVAVLAYLLFGVSDVAIKYLTHAHGPVFGSGLIVSIPGQEGACRRWISGPSCIGSISCMGSDQGAGAADGSPLPRTPVWI